MCDKNGFAELLERVRGGDPGAASELVRKYESSIRVAVRTRLSDPALRRQFDSMDVCQSVLASFFFRAAAGQYDLRDPAQLVALLTKMARNKLAMHARHKYRQRRDIRREIPLEELHGEPRLTSTGPAQQALGRELIERAFALMEPQVRDIAIFRVNGADWAEIAARLGGTAEARRKQFQRAVDKIAVVLDIE